MKIKNLIKKSLFLCMGLLQAEGFIAGTLVPTEQGVIPIEQVDLGDCVTACIDGELFAYSVTYVTHYNVNDYVKIKIGEDYVCAAPEQKIYVIGKQWVNVRELTLSDRLLCINGSVKCIDSLEIIHEQQKMYALSVDSSHLFCVSHHGIIVHNIEPVLTGGAVAAVALSIGCPPAAAVAIIGKCIALVVVGVGVYYAHNKSQRNSQYDKCSVYNNGFGAGGGKDPKDEDNNQDCPFGVYEDAGYHHQNSYGSKSPCPQDGQKCLDNSLLIDGNLKQRVGIEGDKFVIFKQTVSGKFHGYTITWKEIVSGGNSYTEAIRKTLIRSGWVSKSGKIIKECIK